MITTFFRFHSIYVHISSFQHWKLHQKKGDFWKHDFWKHFFKSKMGAKMSWNETLSTRFLPGYQGNDMSQQFGVAFFFVSYMLCVGVVPWKKPWELGGFKLLHGFLKKNITLIPKRKGNQRSEPGRWGISGVCMPTNYKVTITIVIIVINHHLPALFLLLHLHRSRIQWLQILRFQSPECQSLFTDLEVTSQLFEAINKSNPFSLELLWINQFFDCTFVKFMSFICCCSKWSYLGISCNFV